MKNTERGIAHLASGGLLLTPDLRLARIWRRQHDRAQIATGRNVWPTARVLPLDAWLSAEWAELAGGRPELPQALSAAALSVIWRRHAAHDAPGLLDPAELGARGRQSWLRLRAHGGSLTDTARWPQTRDQQAFVGWAQAAQTELRDRQACDPADLARLMVETRALPPAGPPILLAGFSRPTPVQAQLLAALASAGHNIAQQSLGGAEARTWSHAAADPEQELGDLLTWLRGRLEACPDGLHAAVLPGLDARRGAIRRALDALLQPELELPTAAPADRWFDLAGGEPLLRYPVVDAALAAIDCALGRSGWPAASGLLRSPWLAGAAAEQAARIRLDLAWRRSGILPETGVAAMIARARAGGAADFAARLAAASAALAGPPRRRAGAWAQAIGACLASWGWPGETAAGSDAYQAARKLRELLGEFAALDGVVALLDAAAAVDELRRLALQPFQPESGEPAVFVLDALEDPGIEFDSLWVAGLSASTWPQPVAVDPLLPIELQRQLRMPCVTPEACVSDAQAALGSWRARAGALVLSWPRRENDTDADPSPLVPQALDALPSPAVAMTRAARQFGSATLEPLGDDRAPPLADRRARGGVRALELQSQCPFRAFAELRLGAVALEEPTAGIDRRLRGVLLHGALQIVWNGLGSSTALHALDPAARAGRVAAAVEQALQAGLPHDAGAGTRALETDWLRAAIARLLELEAARPAFVVAETEQRFAGEIGGLAFELRADRVDRVGTALVVIDYKTGRPSTTAWRGARPDAPQLPLYAVLHPGRPAGIAFASVAAGEALFQGVAADGGLVNGLRPAEAFALTEKRERGFSWTDVTRHWHAWLSRLAEAHVAGEAAVDPKLGAQTCRRCHLAALCRVADVDDEPDEEFDDGA